MHSFTLTRCLCGSSEPSLNSVVSMSLKLSQADVGLVVCIFMIMFCKENTKYHRKREQKQRQMLFEYLKYLQGEYFWPRESFGNTLNAEIKRSRCHTSLICQWQSQQQSEMWRRYQPDPHQSDLPPHPGSRCVFGETAVTQSPSVSPVHIWSLRISRGIKTVLAFGEKGVMSGVPLFGGGRGGR